MQSQAYKCSAAIHSLPHSAQRLKRQGSLTKTEEKRKTKIKGHGVAKGSVRSKTKSELQLLVQMPARLSPSSPPSSGEQGGWSLSSSLLTPALFSQEALSSSELGACSQLCGVSPWARPQVLAAGWPDGVARRNRVSALQVETAQETSICKAPTSPQGARAPLSTPPSPSPSPPGCRLAELTKHSPPVRVILFPF